MKYQNKNKLKAVVAIFIALLLAIVPIIGCDSTQSALDELQRQIEYQNERQRELEAELDALRQAQAAEKERVEAELAALRAELAFERARVTSLQNELAAERERTDAITEELLVYLTRIDDLEFEAAALDYQLGLAQGQITQLENARVALTNRLTTAESDIYALQKEVSALDYELENAIDNIYELERQRRLLNDRIAANEGNIYELQNEVSALDYELENAQKAIDELESARVALNNRLTIAEDDIYSLQQEVTTLDYYLQNALTAIYDLQQEKADILEDLSDTIQRVEYLETVKYNQAARITALEQQIADLEERIEKLEEANRIPPHFAVITNVSDLQAMVAHPHGTFWLGANLNLTNHIPMFTAQNPFTGKLFAPLNESGNPIYTISNLAITTPTYFAGTYYSALIGENRGSISNIVINNLTIDFNINNPTIENATVLAAGFAARNTGSIVNSRINNININIQANQAAAIQAGAIAAMHIGSDASILNVAASGAINVTSIASGSRAGGLVAVMGEQASIELAEANVDISITTSATGTSTAGAGLVALLNSGSILHSFATGNVTSINNSTETVYAGGLTGNINSGGGTAPQGVWATSIIESFATGNVSATSEGGKYVSPLIARIDDREGSPSNILISSVYSSGNAIVNRTTAPGGNNVFAGGITSRTQAQTGTSITIENAFVTGNLTGLYNVPGNNDQAVGAIIGRNQHTGASGTVFTNLFAYQGLEVVGGVHPTAAQGIHFTHAAVTPTTMANLQNADWQKANLGFDNNVWIFEDGELPTLNMAQLWANKDTSVVIDGLRLSHAPGVFNEEFALTVEVPGHPNATIYWTIDGTEPGPNNIGREIVRPNITHIVSGSFTSGESIEVRDRTLRWQDSILAHYSMTWPISLAHQAPVGDILAGTAFKFRAFVNNIPMGNVATATYIIYDNFANTFINMPIITVTAEYNDFVYIYSHSDPLDTTVRRRIFNYEFFEICDLSNRYQQKFSVLGSSSLGGSGSRSLPQRTFNVHLARGELNGEITHPIFKNLGSLTRFRLWNGGQGAYLGHMRDIFAQTVSYNAGLNVLHSDYRVAIKFVNGEFWGFTTLREHNSNDFFIEARAGIQRGNVAMMDLNSSSTEFVDVQEGGDHAIAVWQELINFLLANDVSQDAGLNELFANYFCKDNFIDYFISNTFFANLDWPFNNVRLYRAINPTLLDTNLQNDGRWRFMLHDMDYAPGPNAGSLPGANVLQGLLSCTVWQDYQYDKNVAFLRILNVFENESFVVAFRKRALELMENGFKLDNLHARYNELIEVRRTLFVHNAHRFPLQSAGGVEINLALFEWFNSHLLEFITSRHAYYKIQLDYLLTRLGVSLV